MHRTIFNITRERGNHRGNKKKHYYLKSTRAKSLPQQFCLNSATFKDSPNMSRKKENKLTLDAPPRIYIYIARSLSAKKVIRLAFALQNMEMSREEPKFRMRSSGCHPPPPLEDVMAKFWTRSSSKCPPPPPPASLLPPPLPAAAVYVCQPLFQTLDW